MTADRNRYVSPVTVVPEKPVASASSTSNSNDLLQAFKEIVQTMKTTNNTERFTEMNVIPEFDPSKRNQTIDMWIIKVNECASIYDWTERQIIYYALPKLEGLAQRWYQGLPSLLFTWSEWQDKLRLAFPSDENYGQLLTGMLACKGRYGDSLEEYFYEKMVLLNRCNITGKNAIDCILFGIEDRSVRTSAEAAQFTEPDKLLVFLRNIKVVKHQEKTAIPWQRSTPVNKYPKTTQKNNDDKLVAKCYNCNEVGHPFYRCKKPIKRCEGCNKLGHLVTECNKEKNGSNVNKTVLRISQKHEDDLKYFKPAKVNGQNLDCFIDFGSQCTMLKESVARNLVDVWSMTNLPILRGFGNSVVNCIGKCNVQIEVDNVKADLQALIVPDNLLQVPLLLGQSFTEQEHVVVYKTKDDLKISSKSQDELSRIMLHASESTVVQGFTEVNVHSDDLFDGDLFVDPSLCQKPNNEYEIIQGVVRIIQGSGKIVIRGLVPSGFELQQNSLLARAVPLKELQAYNVQRVENCPDNVSISLIEKAMINVNENLEILESDELAKMLNEYRDCFAFSSGELGCVKNSKMDIKLNDTTPVVYRPYRLSHMEREKVRNMVEELEDSGIIRPSTSEYASPILLVRKKTGITVCALTLDLLIKRQSRNTIRYLESMTNWTTCRDLSTSRHWIWHLGTTRYPCQITQNG